VSGLIAAVLAIGIACRAAGAEPAAVKPFPLAPFDPATFVQRLFAAPDEAEKAALSQIEVSPQEEQQLGQAALNAYLAELQRQGIRVVRRGRDVAYLQELIAALRPFVTDPDRYPRIQVYLAQSPECEARCFPGGQMVFFRGLLDAAGSEAALVGVIGHELSHLDRGHLLTRARRLKLAEQTFGGKRPEMTADRFFDLGSIALKVWTHPFQPEDEAAADRDGTNWAYQAGYDPREMARLVLEVGKRKPTDRLPFPSFLRSHPPTADRHKAILAVYEELQQQTPKADLYVGRENLRRRVSKAQLEQP
jgi:predicted Zn-dependent protease